MIESANEYLSHSVVCPERPTVHLTSWEARHLHGPGHRYTIMARPWRDWEYGEGHVRDLSPEPEWIDEVREGFLSWRAYEWQCRERFEDLCPGYLVAEEVSDGIGGHHKQEVKDGDTLCCTCSEAVAAAGLCHRVWAAEALVAAGWRVILDGKELGCDRDTQAAA
jgi:hypothetical protein